MLLHLSDLHFGTEKKSCMDAIQLFCQQNHVEVVAVSGDLTQRARLKQFSDCKQFLDSLDIPYLVVPGNHDIPLYHLWDRVLKPFSQYSKFFGDSQQTLETENFYLMGLNSIRRRHHTKGCLSNAQIEYVDDQLNQAPEHKLKLVVVHQPFYTPQCINKLNKDCPTNAKSAIERWEKHHLFGLLHGHLHQTAVYNLSEIFKLDTKHPVLDIHAGTSISWRLRYGLSNSFNTISKDGFVQHYCFDEERKEFLVDFNER